MYAHRSFDANFIGTRIKRHKCTFTCGCRELADITRS